MIEIEMSKDIKAHDPKVIGGFTMRQVVCIGIALIYGIPIMLLVPGSFTVRVVIGILCMMPAILCGQGKVYGMTPDQFIIKIIRNNLLRPVKRKYVTENTYDVIVDQDYDLPIKKMKYPKDIEKVK